jgi:branched-chain amino acid transport system ATP-binding protein
VNREGGDSPPSLWIGRRFMNEQTIIETKQATIRFDGLVAVDNVDFAMKDGEAVGIIGPNGAGKTTFFNLLTGFFPPTEGKIYYAGKDITTVPEYDRVMLGIVRTFQLVSVFDSLPVLDNLVLSTIRFGNDYKAKNKFFFGDAHRSDIMATCMEELEVMGITDKAKLMTSELSYGDKRKLEIAVALSLKPKILLLDEPFAGLSDQEIGEVSRIISRVKEQLSLVIIEHKISRIVDLIQRLCVMHEGKLIAEGPPLEVLSNPNVREVYWGKEEGLTCSV